MNEYERRHNEMIRRFGAECTVLLRSDGSFPLDGPCRLALYGSGARRTVKGGTGSGEVNSRRFVTAEEGLEAAGFTITTKAWLDGYGRLWPEAKKRFLRKLKRAALKRGTLAILSDMGAVMPEPEYALPLEGDGEAAIYVLSRVSGEGSDRKPIPGDILLTQTEKRDILALHRRFRRFLLVLNVGGPVDLSPVSAVRNILLLSQLGGETGNILADVVLGKAAPSGRLTTTWSAWGDYPALGSFGEKNDARYNEGLYVGYRYFDSVGKRPLFGFGFGLSYTDFSAETGPVAEAEGTVTAEVRVKNTGKYAGKEVVQLYVSPPQGRLDKPFRALAAFGKTQTLQPGEEQTLRLAFDLRDLASYDETRASWILEPGDYVLRMSRSGADAEAVAVLRLDAEAVVKQCKNCFGRPDFTDWKPEPRTAETPAGLPVLPLRASGQLCPHPRDRPAGRGPVRRGALPSEHRRVQTKGRKERRRQRRQAGGGRRRRDREGPAGASRPGHGGRPRGPAPEPALYKGRSRRPRPGRRHAAERIGAHAGARGLGDEAAEQKEKGPGRDPGAKLHRDPHRHRHRPELESRLCAAVRRRGGRRNGALRRAAVAGPGAESPPGHPVRPQL